MPASWSSSTHGQVQPALLGVAAHQVRNGEGEHAVEHVHADLGVGPVVHRAKRDHVRVFELAEAEFGVGLGAVGGHHVGHRPVAVGEQDPFAERSLGSGAPDRLKGTQRRRSAPSPGPSRGLHQATQAACHHPGQGFPPISAFACARTPHLAPWPVRAASPRTALFSGLLDRSYRGWGRDTGSLRFESRSTSTTPIPTGKPSGPPCAPPTACRRHPQRCRMARPCHGAIAITGMATTATACPGETLPGCASSVHI